MAKTKENNEVKKQMLLRKIPADVISEINKKKQEIMAKNPYRIEVSNSEAVFKLILGK